VRRAIFWLGLALFGLAFGAGLVRAVRLDRGLPRPTPDLRAHVDALLASQDVAAARDQLWLHLLLEPSEGVAQQLAQVATQAGDRERQLLALRRWASMRPGSAEAQAALAANLVVSPAATRAELREGLQHGRRAVALENGSALAHAALGIAQIRLGRRGPGEASLREAVRLDPGLEVARTALAGLEAR
jgi:tetratricopeptide (TPR) repeat protein